MDRETMARRLLVHAGAILAPDDPSRADLDAMPEELREIVDAFADAALAECQEAAEEAWKASAKRNWLMGTAASIEQQWQSSDTRKKWAKADGK